MTANRAIKEASKSLAECIASEMTLTDPMIKPATNLAAVKKALQATEAQAALDRKSTAPPHLLKEKGTST